MYILRYCYETNYASLPTTLFYLAIPVNYHFSDPFHKVKINRRPQQKLKGGQESCQ